jgi:hypothetical protein
MVETNRIHEIFYKEHSMNEQSAIPFTVQDGNGRQYNLVMVEAPAPPRRSGCLQLFLIGLVLVALFFGLPSFAQSIDTSFTSPLRSSFTQASQPMPLAGEAVRMDVPAATPEPLQAVFQLDPLQQGRDLIAELGAARTAALFTGDTTALARVASGPFLAFEQDVAQRYRSSGLQEQWSLQSVEVHMIDLVSEVASMCTSEVWNIALVDEQGKLGAPTSYQVHAWYVLDRNGPTVLIKEMHQLDTPCKP